jgi:hypothetical protein
MGLFDAAALGLLFFKSQRRDIAMLTRHYRSAGANVTRFDRIVSRIMAV